jgi:integrase
VDEYRELLTELDPGRTKHTRSEDRRDYLAVFTQTGMRDSELYRVRAEHCDFTTREVEVQGTKTKGSRRRIPMTPAVEEILRRRVKARRKAVLFPRWTNVNVELAKACLRIELRWNPGWQPPAWEGQASSLPPPKSERVPPPRPFDPVTPNDLRRTFASWLAQAGVPLQHAAKLMGHESTAMLEKVYARLAPTTLRTAVDKLPRAVTSELGYGPSMMIEPCSFWGLSCTAGVTEGVTASIGFVGFQPHSSERPDA